MEKITLYGRVLFTLSIKAVTGLHIGGSSTGMDIGGVDKAVIRNPLTKEPYIPGSSLRGKMRSLSEKVNGLPQNRRIGLATIHTCEKTDDFHKNGGCPVCPVFGVPAELSFSTPSRLLVRDFNLSGASKLVLDHVKSDLRYAELKTEVAIDRVTSVASPRTMERVPAGTVFGPSELVFSIYGAEDIARLKTVVDALLLVEDDYLGGSGSRGSGKVQFVDISVTARGNTDYGAKKEFNPGEPMADLETLSSRLPALQEWARQNLPIKGS